MQEKVLTLFPSPRTSLIPSRHTLHSYGTNCEIKIYNMCRNLFHHPRHQNPKPDPIFPP